MKKSVYQIIGIGEILWDIFPDGPRFGGAPANFAASSAALARDTARVLMVSAVGDDQLGRMARESLNERGVETSAVQVNSHPTGQVNVQLDDVGIATYQFAENSAWDQMAWTDTLAQLATTCDAVCFGSLGQRGERSRETIRTFVKSTPESALRILDVNLRKPFFDDELIRESLSLANVLKLNDDELPMIAALSAMRGSEVEIMTQLADRYQLRVVALTRGAHGAVICSQHEISERPAPQVNMIDTVGAGDAFTAAMTLGLLHGKCVDSINQTAIAVASFACSQPGATMKFPDYLPISAKSPDGNTAKNSITRTPAPNRDQPEE